MDNNNNNHVDLWRGGEKGSIHSIFGHLIDQYIMMTTMTMMNQTKKKRMVNPKATNIR